MGNYCNYWKKKNGSKLSFVEIENGSGSYSNQFYFTSMLSVHNTKNIKLTNINFTKNHDFDDMHIIYASNVHLKNLIFNNANGDAIDMTCQKIFL